MKLKVTKFAELSNKELTTPATILGKNGQGKTTMMNAYLWAMIGKDKKGRELNEAVYSVNDSGDLRIADVEVDLNGTILRKVCKPIYRRTANGLELATLCSNTYYIDGIKSTEAEYKKKVVELCGGRDFQLFSDPNYFPDLKKDVQMSIVTECLNIDKEKFFVGAKDLRVLETSVRNINAQIKMQEMLRDNAKTTLDGIALGENKEKLIEALRKRQNELFEAKPVLTDEQVEKNNEIQRRIEAIRKENFVSYEMKHEATDNLNKAKENLNDLLNLSNAETRKKMEVDKAITDCKASGEYFSAKLDEMRKNQDKIKQIVTNYETIKKEMKCTLCPICDNDFCENKKVDLKPKAEYLNALTEIDNTIAEIENGIERCEKDIDKYQKTIFKDYSQPIQDLTEKCEALEILANKEKAENEQLAEINKKAEFDFNMSKAGRIEELEQMFEVAQISTETENELKRIDAELKQALEAQKQYNEINGKRIVLNEQLENANNEIKELVSMHIKILGEIEFYNECERRYRTEVEQQLKIVFPDFIEIRLFRERVAGGFENCFEMSFKGKKYQNTALEIYGRVAMVQVFQKQFGVSLPIFCDDLANIVDEELLPTGENLVRIFAVGGESLQIYND